MSLLEQPDLATAMETAYRQHGPRPAITSPAGTLTYTELGAAAAAVATGLNLLELRQASTAGPHRDAASHVPVVAVLLERSPDLIATVLGITAAAATYLPLDPGAPDTYVARVLEQARATVLVTSPERAGRLAARTAARVLTYADLLAAPPSPLTRSAPPGPEDPAYVIYTSGSTGAPKGVVVPHRAVLASTAGRIDCYGAPARVPLLHSPAFDLSSGVWFWTLLTGATLIITPVHLADVAGTLRLIHSYDITHLIYPASLYAPFLDRAASAPPAGLVAVGIGSERWSPALIDRHAELLPGTSLVNEYGPTETCVCSSYALVYDAATAHRAPLTIGPPIQRTGYHLLDPSGQLTSGPEGELAITGANLATGYLNQSQLTAQRFITLPDGQRAYRTGDLVELTPTGDYAFLGRGDRQVQVGGHRVEPGHTESVLLQHPDVAQAHVIGAAASSGAAASLIGYLVPNESVAAGRADWTKLTESCDRYLRERLPPYLVPATYVVLAELPRTPAGKIDSAHLPPPGLNITSAKGPDEGQPLDPVQRSLVTTAAAILGLSAVPVNMPLTQFGASSLTFIRLAAAIEHDHGVAVTISDLFTAGTLTAIAELVRAGAPPQRLPLRAGQRPDDPAAADDDGFPLSRQQEQIWVLAQLAPDALAYSTQSSLLLTGPLDVEALEAALAHVVARHEILRTTFHDGPGGPIQVVHEPWPVHLDVLDLTRLDAPAQDTELHAQIQAAVGVGFDVAALPLVRWHLYRLSEQSWRLLQVEHHFAHDGWSAQLLLAEIRDAYGATATATTPQLTDLPAQYRDYVAWQQDWRDSNDHRTQVDYWRGELAGCPREGATFTPDRPRPAQQTFAGACLRADVPAALVTRLDAVAARHGVSRFATFLSAFALQVWHHTDQQDLVIGSAFANRRQPQTASLIGMFVNALPLRMHVEPTAAAAHLLRSTMGALLGAQDHQELPLLDLLPELDLPRDSSRNALFSLMFAFHDTPRPQFQAAGIHGEVLIEHNGSAKNDLNVICVPNPPSANSRSTHDGVKVLWEYNRDLFDEATAASLLSGFLRVLELLADDPDQPVAALNLLSAQDSRQILTAGTGSTSEPPFAVLPSGFAAAVAAHPNHVALEHNGDAWTYTELDLLVWLLQLRLAGLGAGPGTIVALACPPGVHLVAAMLAVHRLGAAYVCIDPQQPPARVSLLLEDAAPTVVVTTTSTQPALGLLNQPVLVADDPRPEPAPLSSPPPILAQADEPAYLVYTSGSTGTPKAVVASHANAVAALHARTVHLSATQLSDQTGPSPAPRTLITLPMIFDVAPSMLMWTLWSAGTVVFPDDPSRSGDPEHVQDLVARHRITHVNFVAGFYRQLLHVLNDKAATLRVVAIGGEPCTPDIAHEHSARLPNTSLHNEYGPTEATVWASVALLHEPGVPQVTAGHQRVSVGRPVAGAVMAVLRPDGQLAPVGAAGELHIGGAGVAAGYHRRPDLTAQRFTAAAGSLLGGQRLYRSGDSARLTAGGDFEILSRLDEQVKIRGFRVELGEITTCLLQHPDVDDATVALHDQVDTNLSPGLVAYVTTATTEATSTPPSAPRTDFPTVLRSWVAERLPTFMAPSHYVVLDVLPRTSTGKIDRHHLPMPDPRPVSALPDPDGRLTARQDLLLQVWRDQLAQPTLGPDDDFFASGGDSLQAIRAAARARALGVPVTVAELVQSRTVRNLDDLLGHQHTSTAPAAAAVRRPPGTQLALTPIQGWFIDQDFADPDAFHQARLFAVAEICDIRVLRAALAWTIRRHDAFRTHFNPGHPWTAVLGKEAPHDILREVTLPPSSSSDPLAHLSDALRTAHQGLHIGSGRLASFTILNEARPARSARQWLYAAAHHLIIDAVSWDLVVDDIETGYRRLSDTGRLSDSAAPGLPALDQQRVMLPIEAPSPAGEHWRRLANAVKPRLHGGGTGGPAATLAGRARVEHRLSAHATRYLRIDAPRLHSLGTYPLLLAGLARALEPLSDRPGLYAWLEGHGRHRPTTRTGTPPPMRADDSRNGMHTGTEGVVGWLTALYPALFDFTASPGTRLVDQAATINHQLTQIPDHGSGFTDTRYLHPDSPLGEVLARMDLPQVTINYLGHLPSARADAVLRPLSNPLPITMSAATVLPTPLDITVAPDPSGVLSIRVSADPGFLTPAQAAELASAFAADIESAATLVALSPAPSRHARRLYLMHPVGGTVDWYAPLAHVLGPDWDCYGLPHEGAASGADASVPELAAAYLRRIRQAHPRGPYTLAGWSFGAALAHEMAYQSDEVETVILLDPPSLDSQNTAEEILTDHLQALLPDHPRELLTAALNRTATLPPPRRTLILSSRLIPAGATPQDAQDQEALAERLGILLSNHAALARWAPPGPVAGMSRILPANRPSVERPSTPGRQVAREHGGEPAAVAGAGSTVSVVPGDHRSMLTGPGAEQIAAHLRAAADAHPAASGGR